jgi:hypothetical protein
MHGHELTWVGSQSFPSNDEPAILDFWLRKSALLWVRKELLSVQQSVQLSQPFNMLFICLGVYQDVIDIRTTELSQCDQQEIHSPLKRGGSIAQSKRHHSVLERAMLRLERRPLHMRWVHSDLVESRMQIQFGKPLGLTRVINHLIYSR